MTMPKRKTDKRLNGVDRFRLRWLAKALERIEPSPSDDGLNLLRVELILGRELHRELIHALNVAGAMTAADARGIPTRIARQHAVARDLMKFEGLSPKCAASDTLRELHEHGLPLFDGAMFPAPTARETLSLANELTRKRKRPR